LVVASEPASTDLFPSSFLLFKLRGWVYSAPEALRQLRESQCLSYLLLSLIRQKLQAFAGLTNQREANKIGVAMQARTTGITAADSLPGYDCDACHTAK
jgi:hypothetical protein